jgi:tetratricopeptide (TPR) repeat protein
MTSDNPIEGALSLIKGQDFAGAEALLAGCADPAARYVKARLLVRRRDTDGAIAELEEAVARQPDFADAVMLLGMLLGAKDTPAGWAAARKYLRQLMDREPHHIQARLVYAGSSLAAGQNDDAIGALRQVLDIEPGHTGAHHMLSQIHGQQGELDLARTHLAAALETTGKVTGSTKRDLSDLADLERVSRLKAEGGAARVKRARYPGTKLMTGDFGAFFAKEFGKLFAGVPPFIDPGTKFFTLGSCFAREISRSLVAQGYASQHLEVAETVNTTYANRYLVDWLKGELDGTVAERIEELVARLGSRDAILASLRRTDAFVFTMGVGPAFFDRATGAFVMPRPTSINTQALAEQFEFRTTSVAENVENVLHVIGFLKSVNANARIFLTVSPVPLMMSFEYDSAMVADCVSKSVLRVAADEIMRKRIDNVFYWPSFEIVRWAGAHNGPVFGVHDGSEFHVSEDLVHDIVGQFVAAFRRAETSSAAA